jgi:hypothetical protein
MLITRSVDTRKFKTKGKHRNDGLICYAQSRWRTGRTVLMECCAQQYHHSSSLSVLLALLSSLLSSSLPAGFDEDDDSDRCRHHPRQCCRAITHNNYVVDSTSIVGDPDLPGSFSKTSPSSSCRISSISIGRNMSILVNNVVTL